MGSALFTFCVVISPCCYYVSVVIYVQSRVIHVRFNSIREAHEPVDPESPFSRTIRIETYLCEIVFRKRFFELCVARLLCFTLSLVQVSFVASPLLFCLWTMHPLHYLPAHDQIRCCFASCICCQNNDERSICHHVLYSSFYYVAYRFPPLCT